MLWITIYISKTWTRFKNECSVKRTTCSLYFRTNRLLRLSFWFPFQCQSAASCRSAASLSAAAAASRHSCNLWAAATDTWKLPSHCCEPAVSSPPRLGDTVSVRVLARRPTRLWSNCDLQRTSGAVCRLMLMLMLTVPGLRCCCSCCTLFKLVPVSYPKYEVEKNQDGFGWRNSTLPHGIVIIKIQTVTISL